MAEEARFSWRAFWKHLETLSGSQEQVMLDQLDLLHWLPTRSAKVQLEVVEDMPIDLLQPLLEVLEPEVKRQLLPRVYPWMNQVLEF